ncbi:energy-coupling factor ABC transporter ATP-binding protein [Desulforhopalus singaporensis]|uniref:Tungstate transport system ATP-binding protein n=1 Tax=Desulforhopalus singaporensis TaxID=91360 RepID=A0A1H0LF83_9BACT|nr:ABC transporter ATP-binding protein [Desulforhopalus singaporensis]SDO66814.1 tungstate transport system ATP-binding protein [Desulforhopalus singaporensis]
MNLYELNNVTRTHGDRTVLNIDSLSIIPGKIYSLIGPNGAGKTSLLKLLSFLDVPTGGTINFMGRPVVFSDRNLYSFRRDVVLLDQNPIMFSGSVWSNIEFGLKVRKVSSAARKKRIEEVLELVGMERFAHYEAQGLSGGETKRVALARALVLEPKVLLCDEPTANVDNENQEIILEIIKKVNRVDDRSIIFSTHYLSQWQRLADHTLLLQNGALSDLVNENIFKVTVTGRSAGEMICQFSGQTYMSLPSHLLPDGVVRAKIHVDPFRVACLFDAENPGDGNILTGHIVELSQQSGNVRLLVDAGIKLGVYLVMAKYHHLRPGIGDRVRLHIPHEAVTFTYR